MIDTSRKVKGPIFSEGIYAFDIWGIPCYRKVVIRGFSREDFKSPLDAIISTFCAQKKTNDHLRWQFFLPKESP